jgi:hypothetical protein
MRWYVNGNAENAKEASEQNMVHLGDSTRAEAVGVEETKISTELHKQTNGIDARRKKISPFLRSVRPFTEQDVCAGSSDT